MTDDWLLLFVLALIYIGECVVWTPHSATLFAPDWRGHCRIARPIHLLANRSGWLVILSTWAPLIPLQRFRHHYRAFLPAVSVCPDGIFSYVAAAPERECRHEQMQHYLAFEDIETVSSRGTELLVNGTPFAAMGDAGIARDTATFLRTLIGKHRSDCSEAIDRKLASSLDRDRIEERLDILRRTSSGLRSCETACMLLIFAAFPAVIFSGQFTRWLVVWGMALIGTVVVTLCAFYSAHRKIFPERSSDRRRVVSLTLLAPPRAARLADELSLPLLADFHPLAVAAVCCDRRHFVEYARRTLLDLQYPLPPVCPRDDDGPVVTERWFRERLLDRLTSFVSHQGMDLGELLAPPIPDGPECHSYCPRCDQQFVLESGECHACGGIPLVPFATNVANTCHPPENNPEGMLETTPAENSADG